MTDKSNNEITTVVVGGHFYLIPADGDFVTVADGNDVLRRGIVAVTD